jgi:hypothetical protein
MRAAFASANSGRSGSPVGALSEANWRKIEKWRAGQDAALGLGNKLGKKVELQSGLAAPHRVLEQ